MINIEDIRLRVGHLRGLAKKNSASINNDDRAFIALADLVDTFVASFKEHACGNLTPTQVAAFEQLERACTMSCEQHVEPKPNPFGGWFRWTVEFHVEEKWVADGFDLTDRKAHDMITRFCPYVRMSEMDGVVIARPDDEAIAKAQGYKSVDEWQKMGGP